MEVAQRFAAAVAKGDEAAARSCCREWRTDRDGPGRLFSQLVGQPVALETMGEAQAGSDGRAAQPAAITQGGQPVERVTLLGDGEPFLLTGVTTYPAHVARFLAGEAPAVLAWDELTPDPAALAAAQSLAKALAADAATELETALNTGVGAAVIGYLGAAAARGARFEVDEARGLPRLGRGVVSGRLVAEGADPERVYVYVDHADGVSWRAWTPYFRGDTLLAP